MHNDIPQRQNAPDMLLLLRAKSALYDAAQARYRIQAVVLVGVPLALAALKVAAPSLAGHAAVAGLVLFAVDFCWLEPGQKVLKTLGAKMQERFDCSVLGLEWRADRHNAEPTPEEVTRWAGRHPSTVELRDWYSPVVGRLPLEFARVACQRATGHWSASMRRRYANGLATFMAVIAVLLVAAAYTVGGTVQALLTTLATLLPVGTWTLREWRRQRDSAAASDRVRDRATKLWQRLLADDADLERVQRDTRELQNDIYDQRRSDQQVFAFVYRRFRDRDEAEMRVGAEALATDYERSVSARAG